jgi:hypothetical protein
MNLLDELLSKLGIFEFAEMMTPIPGQMDQICIENPFREFNGFQMPDMKVCLNFDELSRGSWVNPLRSALVFVVFCLFFVSIFVVMRRG